MALRLGVTVAVVILAASAQVCGSVFGGRRGESRSTPTTTGSGLSAGLEALGAGLGGGFGAGRSNNPRLPVSPEAYMSSVSTVSEKTRPRVTSPA